MYRSMKALLRGGFAGAMLHAALAIPAAADIKVTIEAPGVQSTQVKSAITMDFNAPTYQSGSYTKLSTSIGTYTAPGKGLAIVSPTGSNAAYGGASKTGLPDPSQTQYVSIGAQSGQTTMELQLDNVMNYFGMYWMAGDAQNNLAFFLGQQLVATFNTQSVIDFIKGDKAYYGNPNNGLDKSEPFVYLNFFGDGSTTFDRIIFTNQSTGSGFETDNHSVAFLDPPGTSGTPVTTLPAAVPEPSTIAGGILGIGAVLARLFLQKKKERAAAASSN